MKNVQCHYPRKKLQGKEKKECSNFPPFFDKLLKVDKNGIMRDVIIGFELINKQFDHNQSIYLA